jgi:hypothetical protein
MDDKEITYCFFLYQQMGPGPKLRVYLEVDLRYVLSLAQSEYVKPMRSNVQLVSE